MKTKIEPDRRPIAERIRQTMNHPCPECGSRYRRGDNCNICGCHAPVKEKECDGFSRVGHAPVGRVWDKKKHKYIS